MQIQANEEKPSTIPREGKNFGENIQKMGYNKGRKFSQYQSHDIKRGQVGTDCPEWMSLQNIIKKCSFFD